MMVINKILSKLKRSKNPEEDSQDESDADMPEDVVETVRETEKQDEDSENQEKILKKVSTLDDEVLKLKMSMNTVKKDVTEVQDGLKSLEENIRDIMMLYEVVSTQINPFIGESTVTATNLEKLERMTKELKDLRTNIDDIMLDLKILTLKNLDVQSMVSEVMQEG